MNTLTVRQRAVLDAIRQSMTTRGYPPSMRELGEAVGLTSSSDIKDQLLELRRKGYIVRDPNRSRAIRVLAPEETPNG
jgi:repressor LexA